MERHGPMQDGGGRRGTRGDADGGGRSWRAGPGRPIIGVTADLMEAPPTTPGGAPRPRAVCAMTYVRAITQAGGIPMVLAPIPELAHEYAKRCDAFVLTGGDDPKMEAFGEPTHPKATIIHPNRQAFEVALVEELSRRPETPVLGVCLGMQLMALCAGGKLNQHMPDDTPTAADHAKDANHMIVISDGLGSRGAGAALVAGMVTSHHRQAVREAGKLRVVARAPDGVIEAIDDPARAFYLGVQWHPERTMFDPLGIGLFVRLVKAAERVGA